MSTVKLFSPRDAHVRLPGPERLKSDSRSWDGSKVNRNPPPICPEILTVNLLPQAVSPTLDSDDFKGFKGLLNIPSSTAQG